MTPFDALALLVMLQTFYPFVSRFALQHAREDRPEYFAGGALIGSSQTHLQLPDGRIYDLIRDEGGLHQAWQVLDVTHEEPGPPDPFPFEEGPLVPFDVERYVPRPYETAFAELVSGHLAELAGAGAAIEQHAGTIASGGDGGNVDGAFEETAGAGERALEGQLRAFEELNPSEGASAAGGLVGTINDAQTDYPDPDAVAPPEIDVDPAARAGKVPEEGQEGRWVDV